MNWRHSELQEWVFNSFHYYGCIVLKPPDLLYYMKIHINIWDFNVTNEFDCELTTPTVSRSHVTWAVVSTNMDHKQSNRSGVRRKRQFITLIVVTIADPLVWLSRRRTVSVGKCMTTLIVVSTRSDVHLLILRDYRPLCSHPSVSKWNYLKLCVWKENVFRMTDRNPVVHYNHIRKCLICVCPSVCKDISKTPAGRRPRLLILSPISKQGKERKGKNFTMGFITCVLPLVWGLINEFIFIQSVVMFR